MTTEEATIPEGKSEVQQNEKQAAVKPEGKTPKGKTTSQSLFPDMAARGVPGSEILETKGKQSQPKPAETVKEEPKPEAKADQKKYLNIEDLKDALLKLKVDGVEEEARFDDVVRRVQLDKHLTTKGQKLSEEEKRIKAKEASLAEREKVLTEMMANLGKSETKPTGDTADSFLKDDPYVKQLEGELKRFKGDFEALKEQTRPFVLNAAIDRVDEYVKRELKLDDFRQYQSKIKDALLNLPAESQSAMDNERGWLEIYKDLKLKESLSQLQAAKNAPKPPEDRPAPKIPPIESGKNVSGPIMDDEAETAKTLMDRAKQMTKDNHRDAPKAWEDYFAYTRRIARTE